MNMLLVGWTLAMAAPALEEPLGEGRVDWTQLKLLASARGDRPPGVTVTPERMEGDARTQLGPTMLKLAREVRVTSSATAGDLLDRGDLVAASIDGNLALWEATEVRYFSSGQVELDAALPMHAWLRPALASMARGRERVVPTTATVTGVVVDARAVKVSPCIAPRLLSPDGEELYSIAAVAAPTIGKWSPVAWVSDAADPLTAKRAGEAPLFVVAERVEDGCDLVLGASDVIALKQAVEGAPVLVNANVAIVARL